MTFYGFNVFFGVFAHSASMISGTTDWLSVILLHFKTCTSANSPKPFKMVYFVSLKKKHLATCVCFTPSKVDLKQKRLINVAGMNVYQRKACSFTSYGKNVGGGGVKMKKRNYRTTSFPYDSNSDLWSSKWLFPTAQIVEASVDVGSGEPIENVDTTTLNYGDI
ncbi:hypothetical protein CSKR_110243 [Clonorchis sinensis]|uniref:Uncharacterized protein n=1 Tax=Clonorchis sinensis TaxID=79923 RepID=A0A419PET3_CLOSI|nr:hypothetical protein CSKR_110243 [Clonorchis sinensis]